MDFIGAFAECAGGLKAGEGTGKLRQICHPGGRLHQRDRKPETRRDSIDRGRNIVHHFGINGDRQRMRSVPGIPAP